MAETKDKEMTFDECMVQAQSEMQTVAKTSKGYGYNYANLPAVLSIVKPALNRYGIELSFGGKAGTETVEQYPIFRKGEAEREGVHVEIPINQNAKNIAQEIGSLMTYSQRYALTATLALEVDDDDAAIATRQGGQRQAQPKNNTVNQNMMNTISNKLNEIGVNVGKKPKELAQELESSLGCPIRQLPINRFTEAMDMLNRWEG